MPASRCVRRLGGVLVLTGLVAASSASASAQRMRTERVRFARGASTATMSAAPRQGRPVRYLVGARQGQSLAANAASPRNDADCTVQVYAPGRRIDDRYALQDDAGERYGLEEWSGRLSRTGDYQVLLINAGTAGTCTVEITAQ